MRKLILILLVVFAFPCSLFAREFINSFMQINLGYSYALVKAGDIRSGESKNPPDGGQRLKYSASSVNFMLDITPFQPISFNNENSAIKIGLRGGFRMHTMEQRLTARVDGDKKDYSGRLLEFQCLSIGALIRYAPSMSMVEDLAESYYSSNGGFTAFVLYGRMFNGQIDAFAAKRAHKETVSVPYESTLTGHRIDAGLGAEISICAINLGVNLYYSCVLFQLKNDIYPAIGRSPVQHELNLEVYIGLPLVNF